MLPLAPLLSAARSAAAALAAADGLSGETFYRRGDVELDRAEAVAHRRITIAGGHNV